MFVLESYSVAIVFCVITMLCWGSWANTQKLAGKRWRFELFYWDYVIGVLLMALVFAFTLGNNGQAGRGFLADVAQASPKNVGLAMLGGVIFNAANILLVAAIAIAGMSVAFPVGIGLALVEGVVVNYIAQRQGNPVYLFAGVAFVALAIILNALAYRKLPGQSGGGGAKGLVLSILCGLLMGLFYYCVGATMPSNSEEFITMPADKITPYTAMVFFSLGIFASNFVLNTLIMRKPFSGTPLTMADYFQGSPRDHLWGIVGGMIWAVGMTLNIIAAGKAGFAISYGLGQGATLVAALWGVFVWREFRNAPASTKPLLAMMFAAYVVGLVLVVAARVT